MPKFIAVFLALILLGGLGVPASAQYEAIVERTKPSVVLVGVQTARGLATGTGFFVNSEGYIVTARHVIEDADRLVVVTPDGKQLEAVVVRYSSVFDGAVLKVQGSGYPSLAFGDSDSVRQGQEVLVIGYPLATTLGMESATVTRGIVSALRPSEGLIQIDAAINPGNSGGPVLNARGEVIAIAVAQLRGGQLINFAVAANLIRTLTAQLSAVAIPAPRSSSPPSAQPTPPAPPQPSPPSSSPNLIQPGVGIGLLRLGMTIREAIQVMGPYSDSGKTRSGTGVYWSWAMPGGSFILRPRLDAFAGDVNGKIREIHTTSTTHTTAGGNRVGGFLEDFKKEFGVNYKVQQSLHYNLPVIQWPGMFVSWDPAADPRERKITLIGVE